MALHQMPFNFYSQKSRRAAPMPRPKRELTKNGRSVSVKLTQSEYDEWVKLGKGKWLRALLKDSRFERKANASV
jgi:hypothetical protein